MKQFHLHQLLQELSSRLICPHCKKKIPIQNLDLKESNESTCVFEAKCESCENPVSVNAIIETHDMSKVINPISHPLEQNVIPQTPITNQEIDILKNQIPLITSFKTFFNS